MNSPSPCLSKVLATSQRLTHPIPASFLLATSRQITNQPALKRIFRWGVSVWYWVEYGHTRAGKLYAAADKTGLYLRGLRRADGITVMRFESVGL